MRSSMASMASSSSESIPEGCLGFRIRLEDLGLYISGVISFMSDREPKIRILGLG